jgi:hypothetical protein
VYVSGRRYYTVEQHPCGRCGGQGNAEAWARTGFTCYECNGSGFPTRTREVTVYLADALDKLNAKAVAKAKAHSDAEKARNAAFETTYAELLAKVNQLPSSSAFIHDVIAKGYKYGTLSDAQVAAVTKAVDADLARQAALQASQHVGTVGARQTFDLTVTFITSFEGAYGTTYINGFKDADGNIFIHKGSKILVDVEVDTYPRPLEKGDKVNLSATIKEHGVREGVKQTIITRPSRADLLS